MIIYISLGFMASMWFCERMGFSVLLWQDYMVVGLFIVGMMWSKREWR